MNENNIDVHMFGDRDQLVAYFQDLTSIDDIDECLALLESANWNLEDAVQSYFAQNDIMQQDQDQPQHQPQPQPQPQPQLQPQIITTSTSTSTASATAYISPVNSNELFSNDNNTQRKKHDFSSFQDLAYVNYLNEPTRRMLEFEIEHKNNKKLFLVPDTQTIGYLKTLCESEFNISYDRQILKGWKDRDPTLINTNVDSIKLKELHLPLRTTLFLLKKKSSNSSMNSNNEEDATNENKKSSKSPIKKNYEQCNYDIYINISSNNFKNSNELTPTTSANSDNINKQNFHLKYDSDKLLSKVKNDLTKLTSINYKNQVWFWKIPITNTVTEPKTSMIASNETTIEEKGGEEFIIDNYIAISKKFDDLCLYELKHYLYNLYIEKYSINNHSKAPNNNLFKLEFYIKSNKNENNNNEITIDDDNNKNNISIDDNEDNNNDDNDDNDDDDDDDDDEDGEENDINFQLQPINEKNNLKRKALISDDYKCETEAIDQFIKEFSERYGQLIPLFFIGSLEDAIHESLLLPVNDRKLLAIYLHSDSTIYCNIFCSKILCDEEIINYLSLNFVLWPWDLTLNKNEEYFYNLCNKYLGGSMVIHTIKQFKSKLPALILLTRVRSNNEIIAVIEGDTTKEQLLMNLMQSDEMFQQQRSKDAVEEKQREDRERIKREQDAAYQASLDYDKAKRQKQEEELNKELELKREQELLKIKLEKEFTDKKNYCLNNLRAEPELTNENSKQLTTIRIKELDGKIIQRKFLIDDKLEQVIYYLGSLGYFDNKYKLLTTWPRRDLAVESKEKTLHELKLYPQETIILEERDE